MNEKKNAQTPRETEQALDETAKKLEEMDRAEGDFGEAMTDALTDEYLEEVVGGFPPVTVTTPPKAKYKRPCDKCEQIFITYDIEQWTCDACLNLQERKPY